MQDIIFIDGGSLPTPEGLTREWVKSAAENRNEDEKLFSLIRETFPLDLDDKRRQDVGENIIQNLKKLTTILQRTTTKKKLSDTQKQTVQDLLKFLLTMVE